MQVILSLLILSLLILSLRETLFRAHFCTLVVVDSSCREIMITTREEERSVDDTKTKMNKWYILCTNDLRVFYWRNAVFLAGNARLPLLAQEVSLSFPTKAMHFKTPGKQMTLTVTEKALVNYFEINHTHLFSWWRMTEIVPETAKTGVYSIRCVSCCFLTRTCMSPTSRLLDSSSLHSLQMSRCF